MDSAEDDDEEVDAGEDEDNIGKCDFCCFFFGLIEFSQPPRKRAPACLQLHDSFAYASACLLLLRSTLNSSLHTFSISTSLFCTLVFDFPRVVCMFLWYLIA